MEGEKHRVIVQKWEESERNWGVRPDGYSLHLTAEDKEAFVAEYWSKMPKMVPDEYSRPSGKPYDAEVGAEIFAEVQNSKNGIRKFDRPPSPYCLP